MVGVQGVELQVLESGTEFGGYRIEGLLGRGGMSEVYRASNPRLGNTIAVKLLTRELGKDEIFRERFVRESQLAASLNHPNVIPIFDAGEADGLPYIAMRYVAGSDLQELLSRDGALSVEAAIAIVSQIGAALDAAHDKGLIHRDVKPANILIESNGDATPHVYLSDFGVAKHGGSRSGLTSTGQFVGTVDYIAPEQIEGKALSGATDVYSLACVLYQTLAGAPPFDRDTDVGMIYAHLVEPPPPITERRPDLPAELDGVLAKALSKRPEDRYQTCRELVVAVRQAVGLQAPATVGGGINPRAAATRLAASPTAEEPLAAAVPPTTASPSPALTPVGETVLAGAGSTMAASGPPAAAAQMTEAAASPPAADKAMPTELAEKKTVLMRRFWRSKRILVGVAAALVIAGAAAAAAQTLGGGGSSSPKQQGGSNGQNGSNNDGGSVSGTAAELAKRKKQAKANGTTTTKSTKKTLQTRRSNAKAKKAKKAKKKSTTSSTASTLQKRRSSTSSSSTASTLQQRRASSSSSSSSSSSGSTASTLQQRRAAATSSSSSSSSTKSVLQKRRSGK